MMQEQRARGTSVICIAASADAELLAQWEGQLLPLQQAGLITVWSELQIMPGLSRTQEMHNALKLADLVILLVSADFFASDECVVLMEQALQRHQQGTACVIPLLLRPVTWQESELGKLPCIPANKQPVTDWANVDSAFEECARALRQMLGRRITTPLRQQKQVANIYDLNRTRMLQRLRRAYQNAQKQALGGAVQMELGLTQRPDAVSTAANLLFRSSQQVERPLPVGTSIRQVYEDAGHELLILGEPGAGKSTLLLKLAQYLLEQAELDNQQPLPVILPLSTWANKRPSLQTWLGEQLTRIYHLPQNISTKWLYKKRILPLLDGLDEMTEDAQLACIIAINNYHQRNMTGLVVCCRKSEYEVATRQQHLALLDAVVIQPLTSEDLEAYLEQAGQPLSGLRRALRENADLQELAKTPLMLNILMLTYQDRDGSALASREKRLQQQVWDDYVQQMVARKGDNQRYPLAQTRVWLGWLARQMQAHNQTTFHLEYLQPDWLPQRLQSFYRWSAVLIEGLFIGLLAGILATSFIWLLFFRSQTTLISWLSLILPLSIGAGLIIGLLDGLRKGPISETINEIQWADTLIWSWEEARRSWLGILIVGLVNGFLAELQFQLLGGILFGLLGATLCGLMEGRTIIRYLWAERSDHSPYEVILHAVKNSLTKGILMGLLSSLIVGLIGNLVGGPLAGIGLGLFVGVAFCLYFGLYAMLLHLLLRFWLARAKVFPWGMVTFLNDATTRVLLRREGSGYGFVHRLLLEHFAEQYGAGE